MPMGEIMSRAERCDIGSLAIAELLCGGVTTVLEMEEDADVFAPYIEQVGMRASMGIMVHDVDVGRLLAGEVVFDPAVRDAQLEQAIGFAEQWHGRAEDRNPRGNDRQWSCFLVAPAARRFARNGGPHGPAPVDPSW